MTNRPSGSTPTDSLAPLELDRLTIEEEAAFMNRGRGKTLTGIALALGAAVFAGALMLRSLDTARAYTHAGEAVRALAAEHFDGYFQCAVPERLRMPVASGEELAQQLERVTDHLGQSYGATLQRCDARLEPLPASLQALPVPAALEGERARLVEASQALSAGTRALRESLAAASPYTYAAVASEIDQVAKAWGAFEDARAALLAAIDAR